MSAVRGADAAAPEPTGSPGPQGDLPLGDLPLGEFGRIARYFRPLAVGCPGALDLTDDAALLDVPAGRQLVVTTDAMVAGIHFLPDDPPADVAAKLLRTNLSDLAAMGAAPWGYTLVVSLPRDLDETWLAGFAQGLAEDQGRFGVTLIGGDSVATRGPITLAITALGLVPHGTALTRRVRAPNHGPGATRSDRQSDLSDGRSDLFNGLSEQLVFVTGTIGDAALGLQLVLGALAAAPEVATPLIARLRRPDPRLAVGQALRGVATAAIDVSDGLIADLGHICEVTGCAARIDAGRVPLSASARTLLARHPELLVTALTGGDDYELVVTVPTGRRATVAALAAGLGVAITEIGRLEPGPAGKVEAIGPDGAALALPRRGWSHFPGSDERTSPGAPPNG